MGSFDTKHVFGLKYGCEKLFRKSTLTLAKNHNKFLIFDKKIFRIKLKVAYFSDFYEPEN